MHLRKTRFVAAAALVTALAGCQLANQATPGASGAAGSAATGGTVACDTATKVKVGFSAPAADHGWLGAVIKNADAEAAEHGADMDYVSANGGTDADQQANNVRTLAQQDLDAIAILPYDGAALTPVAQELMDKGVPVINIDREFGSPTAFRTPIAASATP